MSDEAYNDFVAQLLAQTGRGPEAVIPILQGLQRQYRYLPADALRAVCAASGLRLADLVGVASFYHQFRLQPTGRHMLCVCHGTACHVKGAENIRDALHRHLHIPAGSDTSPDGEFTVARVACLGCCTLAPVVQVEGSTYGHLTADTVPALVADYLATGHARPADVDAVASLRADHRAEIRVGLGSCCMAKGSDELFHRLRATVADFGAPADVKRVGCVGMCHQTPIVEVRLPGGPTAFYARVGPEDAEAIVRRHFRPLRLRRRLARWVDRTLTDLVVPRNDRQRIVHHVLDVRGAPVESFMCRQVRLSTEGFGELDPLNLDEYLALRGFDALKKTLARAPADTIAEVRASGLRGRGGAGFPTAEKWSRVRQAPSADGRKFVIVNGDEGDPGAFMDRMLMESFPFRVIEGLLIAAYCVGAAEGYIYVRAEYPRAVSRLRTALQRLTARGLLGDNILGGPFHFHLHLFEGAGAFVCGEETALIESIEGRRGIPRLKPPYPADRGMWGQPTLINNVETLALVPWIVRHGAAAFAAYGTSESTGTKVFALAGEVRRTGLIEVPMGITLRAIVEEIGGGCPSGQPFKAVQIGGPSGGCLPAALADLPVDFQALTAAGAIMGSGGLVVLDEDACMVDVARYFMAFLCDESCGLCTFCRIGTMRLYEILDRLCAGRGRPRDLDELERLAEFTIQGSICGLGRTAPNPVLTTLRYFRAEYEAHLAGRCPAGRCKALIHYVVQDTCTGCTLCAQHCPSDAIPAAPYHRHRINDERCTRCDVCRLICPENAIAIESGGQLCATRARPDAAVKPLSVHE